MTPFDSDPRLQLTHYHLITDQAHSHYTPKIRFGCIRCLIAEKLRNVPKNRIRRLRTEVGVVSEGSAGVMVGGVGAAIVPGAGAVPCRCRPFQSQTSNY